MQVSNSQIAKMLRSVAAAYSIKKIGNIFQVRAYENAADAIEHSTVEVQDLWIEGKLDIIPGVGQAIRAYLSELFRTGRVKHFEEVQKNVPKVVFALLEVPGVGPKTAQEIAELGVSSIDDLKKQIKSGELTSKGFSGKIAQKIMNGISELNSRGGRMLLPYASAQADKILEYLRKSSDVENADSLGSLRRKVATVGDLDFAVASKNPKAVVDYFCQMSGVARVLDQGEDKASVVLQSGIQADLLVGSPSSYGALLQHFTGSKKHNIHLRTLAEKKGLSLSEYGIKLNTGSKKRDSGLRQNDVVVCKTEDEFYKILGMQTPSPEIREDTGEIEAALAHKLPTLVDLKDIKGDLHLHSNFPIVSPSHGSGVDSIEEIVEMAVKLGYEYVGISDHPPGHNVTTREETIKWVEKRTKFIQELKKKTKSIRVLNALEIDILKDGGLSVPDEALETLDYCIAGIHSGHRGEKDEITNRLLKALESPYVDIISHPTNRLLNERQSSEADWEVIFKYAAENKKILEINAYPNRLDLRDDLVRQALKYGVSFAIDTDAHEVSQMENMQFGVSVARRGWATKNDVVNTWTWTELAKWFKIR